MMCDPGATAARDQISSLAGEDQMKTVKTIAIGLSISLGMISLAQAETAKDKASQAINQYLDTHPEMVIDFSGVSGEYCINTWKVGGGHMTHYAIDPSKTTEDVIDFVPAQTFIDAGIDITKLPRLPEKLGMMQDGQWYFLPKGAVEPHHGSKGFPAALIVRATDIQ
jgi:hypothetical protein